MTNRGLLRRHLRQAWVATMQEVYAQQLINSERALQVHFAARLMEAFRKDRVRRFLFVEPKLMLDQGQRIHPDLLVCNSREVIGAIELKYQPNLPPRYVKDFTTLDALAESCTSIRLENKRYRGPGRGGLVSTYPPIPCLSGLAYIGRLGRKSHRPKSLPSMLRNY